jgi:hypothetical protein
VLFDNFQLLQCATRISKPDFCSLPSARRMASAVPMAAKQLFYQGNRIKISYPYKPKA